MPNWCTNRLTVFGPEKSLRAFYWAAKGKSQHYAPSKYDLASGEIDNTIYDFSFHALVPIPDEVMEKQYDPHGYAAERELWGVKWGASYSKIDAENFKDEISEVTYTFDTPWGIADRLFKKVSAGYPDLTFVISFAEETPSRGRVVYQRGREFDISDADLYAFKHGDFGPSYPENDDDEEAMAHYEEEQNLWYNHYLETHDKWVADNKAAYAEAANRHAHTNAP